MSPSVPSQELLPAKESALQHLLPDHDERRDELTAYFEAKKKHQEEIARIREASEASQLKSVLLEERHYEPEALAMLSKLRTLQMRSPYKAARVWFQLLVGGNALELDRNIEAPPPRAEEDGPVFDRTRTGTRQGGDRYGPQRAALLRQAGENVTKTTISTSLVTEMLELTMKGLPIQKPPGRPSNVWRASEEHVHRLVTAEMQRAKEAGEEIGHQEAAERNAQRIREGISPLRLIDGGRSGEPVRQINLED